MHGFGVEMVAAGIAVLVVPRTAVVAAAQYQTGLTNPPIVAQIKSVEIHRTVRPPPSAISGLAIIAA